MMAKRTCEIIRPRSFSAQPETTWREAVSDKTAALDARMKGTDERLASVQKAKASIEMRKRKTLHEPNIGREGT